VSLYSLYVTCFHSIPIPCINFNTMDPIYSF